MRFKNRFNETVAFLSFAFYPKTTLVACVIFSVIVVTILGVAMALTPEGSGFYNLQYCICFDYWCSCVLFRIVRG